MNSVRFTNDFEETITVNIGDTIQFKADVEQVGVVTRIESRGIGRYSLFVHNENGFPGEYLRYAKDTDVNSEDVWI